MTASGRGPRRWFFDAWSTFYDLPPVQRAVYRPVHEAVLKVLVRRSPSSVLDIGCGTGILTARIRDGLPSAAVWGCDFSLGMLHQATSQRAAPGQWVQGDATRLPLRDAAVEAVVSTEAFHWFPDADAALSEFRRILVPGGTLLLGLVNVRTTAGSRAFDAGFRAVGQPAHWPTRQELANRLSSAGFAVEEQRRVVRPFGLVLPTVVTVATAA